MRKKSNSTIKDVARLADASIATVSRVLNNTDYPVSEMTRKRILEAAKELKYMPNGLSKALKNGRSHEIGVVVPSLLNPYYAEVVSGIEHACYERGYMPVFCSSNNESKKESQHLDFFLKMRMDGLIVSTLDQGAHLMEKVQQAGIATVFFDQPVQSGAFDSITYDFFQAGKLAASYLVDLGHRSIAFLALPFDRKSRKDRYEGFCAGLKEANIDFPSEHLFIADLKDENVDTMTEFSGGEHLAEQFMQMKGLTAVVAMNDLVALDAMNAFSKKGKAVPEDVSVVGFDDIAFASMANPSLTTVKQPSYDMGREAAITLIDKIENNTTSQKAVMMQPRMIVRNSVCDIK